MIANHVWINFIPGSNPGHSIFFLIFATFLQSLFEYFPISSSFHISLFFHFFSFLDFDFFFSFIKLIQFSSVLPLIYFLRKYLYIFFVSSLYIINCYKKKNSYVFLHCFFFYFFFSTLPTLIVGFFLRSYFKSFFIFKYNFFFFLFNFFILLFLSFFKNKIKKAKLSIFIYVGFFSIFSLFSGISRFGFTVFLFSLFKIKKKLAIIFSLINSIIISFFVFIDFLCFNFHFFIDYFFYFFMSFLFSCIILKKIINFILNMNFFFFFIYSFFLIFFLFFFFFILP